MHLKLAITFGARYKRLAMKYHPVIHTDKDAAEKNFKEIAESFEVLSDCM